MGAWAFPAMTKNWATKRNRKNKMAKKKRDMKTDIYLKEGDGAAEVERRLA
jgi:hypothetical protein